MLNNITPFPLVMPKKFQKMLLEWIQSESDRLSKYYHKNDNYRIDNIIFAYRNYYQSKVRQKPICWTNREKPEWIK
jgi:hypothetical protein